MDFRLCNRRYFSFLLYLYVGAAILIITVSLIVKKGDDILWINGHNSEILDRFFLTVTRLGEGWIFIPAIVVSLFIRFYYTTIGLFIWIFHGIICAVTKRILFPDALRPTAIMDQSNMHFIPGVDVHTSHSFPSGHTATIFCAAVFFSLLVRNRVMSILFLLIAVMVGYSRVYLLQHFLLDIAGGAFIGITIAFLAWSIFERMTLPMWMNQLLQIKVLPQNQSV